MFEENDGDADTVESLDGSLPVHCITVFVPLVDLCDENGPTEFFPTTHRCSAGRRQAAMAQLRSEHSHSHSRSPNQAADEAGSERGERAGIEGLTFNAAAGSAILFDYRILHRGLGNGSPADRPMLYFTYGRQWFRDSTNYPALSLFD